MKYLVKKIMEPDYGCEERAADYVRMDDVILRSTDGNEISMQLSDAELYEKNISEGDWVYFDVNNVVFKEQ